MGKRSATPRWATALGVGVSAGALALVLSIAREPDIPKETLLELFEVVVPEFVVSLNAAAHGEPRARKRHARAEERSTALSSRLPEELRRTVSATLSAARHAATAKSSAAAAMNLEQTIASLNAALAKDDHAYYVDGEIMETEDRRTVVIFTFRVAAKDAYETPDGIVSVLHLERLDGMNWRFSMSGFAAEGRPEVVVLRSQVNSVLEEELFPILRQGEARASFGSAPGASQPHRRLAEVAARAMRDELSRQSDDSIRSHFASSVARHEVQHVIDREKLEKTRPDGLSPRAWAEASAYLAEMARDQYSSALNLSLLVGYALSTEKKAENIAARHALTALLPTPEALHGARAYENLFALPIGERRARAEAAWVRLFERPLDVNRLATN